MLHFKVLTGTVHIARCFHVMQIGFIGCIVRIFSVVVSGESELEDHQGAHRQNCFPNGVLSSSVIAQIPSCPADCKTLTANTVLCVCLCLFPRFNGYTPSNSLTVLKNDIVEQHHRCMPTANSTSCWELGVQKIKIMPIIHFPIVI